MTNIFNVLIIALLFSAGTVQAEQEGVLSQLLAPGPMIDGHKKLEGSDCLKCHDAGKGIPDSKCLDCHKELTPFVKNSSGFHGMAGKTCIECHSDHKGRDYDSIKVDIKNFDHTKLTGYKLEGKHSEIKCLDCHKEKRTGKFLKPLETRYFGKISNCNSCHKKDDVHFFSGSFGAKDCSSCHGLKSWKENLKFDHSRDTKFKLLEKHAELKCTDCHQSDKKKKIFQYQFPGLDKKQCLSCHQDQHRTNLSPRFQGGQCTTCHGQSHWKIEKFNHDVTKYQLKFKHQEATCVDCHIQKTKQDKKSTPAIEPKNFNWTGLATNCLSCHEDFHKFAGHKSAKMGDLNQCSKCHTENSWTQIHDFSHSKNTRYALDGKHLELKCNDCHLPAVSKTKVKTTNRNIGSYHWDKLETKTCENCHSNPHLGQFKKELLEKKCSSCHNTESWSSMKAGSGFDHSKTRFALTDAHGKVACASCHNIDGKQVFKFKSVDQKFCVDCHDNIHKDQFTNKFSAQSCTNCHSTKNFTERLVFNHSETTYPLKGAHEKLSCTECHLPLKISMNLRKPNFNSKTFKTGKTLFKAQFSTPDLKAKACLSCHQDFHKGQLGNDCAKCHTDKSWKNPIFDHALSSRFPLLDKHATVECKKCHVPASDEWVNFKNERRQHIKYKPLGVACMDCHKDVHKGNFGKQCQECHSPREWKTTKDFHKNFTLTGVHYSLNCAECHKDGKKLAGLSQQCLSCHQKDDPHTGTLPNCKECHRQQFWEVAGFKHSMTRFPLRGAHRTAECMDCHYKGGSQASYQGLSTQCQACHSSDFTRAGSIAAHATQTPSSDCSQCHRNQFSF